MLTTEERDRLSVAVDAPWRARLAPGESGLMFTGAERDNVGAAREIWFVNVALTRQFPPEIDDNAVEVWCLEKVRAIRREAWPGSYSVSAGSPTDIGERQVSINFQVRVTVDGND